MSSDHRDERTRIFLHLNNQTSLYRLTLLKHEMNKRGFNFEGILRWPVTNVVNLIHWYSYLLSCETVVGYRKLRSFQGTQFNLIMSI